MEETVQVIKVEIVQFLEDGFEVIAVGHIEDKQAKEMGLLATPDNVIRITDILWKSLTPEAKTKFLAAFDGKFV